MLLCIFKDYALKLYCMSLDLIKIILLYLYVTLRSPRASVPDYNNEWIQAINLQERDAKSFKYIKQNLITSAERHDVFQTNKIYTCIYSLIPQEAQMYLK